MKKHLVTAWRNTEDVIDNLKDSKVDELKAAAWAEDVIKTLLITIAEVEEPK